jgi:glycosyltransferase involved in cell wall biosynthesis
MEGRFLINRCAAVVANSNWTRERMREVYGIRSDAVTVLHNGIDVDAAPGPVERRRNGRLEVAFVGRLVRFKRVDRIIRALAMLLPRRDVHVIVAGGGPVEDELRTLAEQLGVASQVEFLGWQSEVGAVLSEADVLVLPSENEPFGLVMLEASVLGLLTVAFADGGGALEIVAPDGRVVHSIRELADFLGGLEGSEALSMPARQERSSWTRREFSISETAKRYVDIYKTIDAAPR